MPNLRLAFRTLSRTPFVTIVAALSLGLGIGANAGIFSIYDEILRRPLPVHEPERLVNLGAPGPKRGFTSCGQAGDCDQVFSHPMFRDLAREQTSFEGIAGHVVFGASIGFERQTISSVGSFVSGSYFPLLRISPAVGRLLNESDDQTEGGHPVAVLDYDFWSERLEGDPSVIDQTVIVNGQPMTIVGVAPEGFRGTILGEKPAVYVPLTMREQLLAGEQRMDSRVSYFLYLFGRLRPNVTLEQAQAALNGPYGQILREVERPLQTEMTEQTLAQFVARQVQLTDGSRGQSRMLSEATVPILMLFVLTGIVLLIACGNIANLLLARGAGRAMEVSVRLSLGATRKHLLTQLLTESVLLAVLGGLASLVFATWTLAFIRSMLPAEAIDTLDFSMSWPAVVFALSLAVVTGFVFGLFPALHSTRVDLITNLRNNAGAVVSGRQASRFRNGLVVAQIALSMALLTSAGLFIKSLRNINRVDLGIDVADVFTFRIVPQRNGYTREEALALYQRVEEELASGPGVTGVTAATVPLLGGDSWGSTVSVEGFVAAPDADMSSQYSLIGTEYFRVLGVPLLTGREFASTDVAGAPRVAVVNEAFVARFGLGTGAVGKYIGLGRTDSLNIQIVGVVRNSGYSDVKDVIPPVFYLPYRQDTEATGMSFFVRTANDPVESLRSVPPLIARLDPDLPVEELRTMTQQIRENVSLDRMISILSASFAVVATLLASVGLYGVLAYSVAQRTREIGVRMALGAHRNRVRWLVLRQVGWMTFVGGIIGLLGAVGFGQAARSLLFGLEGQDPAVLILSAVVLAAVALLAAFMPAQRASRVDPMQALRYQ